MSGAKDKRSREQWWIDYCCATWPDLPRDAIEAVALRPGNADVYRVRRAARELLMLPPE